MEIIEITVESCNKPVMGDEFYRAMTALREIAEMYAEFTLHILIDSFTCAPIHKKILLNTFSNSLLTVMLHDARQLDFTIGTFKNSNG